MKAILVEGSVVALFLGLLILSPSVLRAENIDPFQDDSQYAYGENVGWLNAEPLGDGGPGIEVEGTKLTGFIWAENIGWISLSCENTASCGAADYGIANDGNGNLSGYAWAENVGWISFSCQNTDSCDTVDYGVVIDSGSGEFCGYAWAENIGWINFEHVYGGIKTSWGVSVADPIPDIKANGSDGTIIITTEENLSVTVALDSGSHAGNNADWWVLAKTARGKWFYYNHALGNWFPGQSVTHQGPLFDLACFEVLNRTLPGPTTYNFHFGVDTIMNGTVDMGSMFYDSVTVEVVPEEPPL